MADRTELINSLCQRLARMPKPLYEQLLLVLDAGARGFDGDPIPTRSATQLVAWAEQMDGLEALQDAMNRVLRRPETAGEDIAPWVRIDQSFLDRHRSPSDEQLLRYFDGQAPHWGIAQDRRVPMLALGQVILGHIRSNTGEVTFDLFTGATGEGKTTLLYQLAAHLGRNEDTAVHWLSPSADRFDPTQAARLVGALRTVLVVDYADQHVENLHQLLLRGGLVELIGGTSKSVHLIAAARTDRWRACEGNTYSFHHRCRFQWHRHIHFDIEGAKAIIDGWSTVGDSGLRGLARVPPERRAGELLDHVRLARTKHNASLFGALLDIRFHPKELLAHLQDLLRDLSRAPDELLATYVAIALVDCATGAGLDERVLAEGMGLERSVLQTKLLPRLEEEASVVSAAGGQSRLLQTRHPAIAGAVLRIIDAGQLDIDLETILGRLVGAAVRLSREKWVDAFVELVHCSARLESRLRGIVTPQVARQMAVAAATHAWDADPRPDFLSELLSALRRSGQAKDAVKVAAESWPLVTGADEDHRLLRHLLQAWAHAHAKRGDDELALWLGLCSLSDQVVNTKTGRRIQLPQLDLRRGLVYAVKNGANVPHVEAELAPLQPLLGLEVELPSMDRPNPKERWRPEEAPCPPEQLVEILSRIEQRVPRKRLPPSLAELGPLTFEVFERAYNREIHALYGGLLPYLPREATVDDIVDRMGAYCRYELGFEPTPEQRRAFEELATGKNVLLNTPTGSGKSIVGLFAHALALIQGERSVYTAPTKALVNEKFFDLARHFGARNVGILTGDASANRDAPVICCTAEILANKALSSDRPEFATVVMDEFHYYGDPQRGRAWLLPLVQMLDARFVLMSATVGAPEERRQIIEKQTGAPTALVRSEKRPVPLRYEYKKQLLSESIVELRKRKLCPAYIVSFTKAEATEVAERVRQMLPPPEDKARFKERRAEIEAILAGERLDTPFSSRLRRLLLDGIGVHHAGMLPRYRRLVERLAGKGLLEFISGTDTLGVGVNMPILTVVFTRLWKFVDGESCRLTTREFQQLSGRAGRQGMKDEFGMVWVQHPEHLTENERKKQKQGKKFRAVDPPKGYLPWDESHMDQLRIREPEPLQTQFEITGNLVLNALRRRDGEQALRQLVQRIGLPRSREEMALERITEVIGGLAAGGHITKSREPTSGAPTWNVHGTDAEGIYERPEARFLAMALGMLDKQSPTFALQVVSFVEATQEDPTAVVRCQRNAGIARLREQLRALSDEPEHESKRWLLQEQIDNWVPPDAEADLVRDLWQKWEQRIPVLAEGEIQPRSIVRAMYEGGYQFNDYVREYDKLDNDEGILLKHLSQTYRSLKRELPAWPHLRFNEQLRLITDWLYGLIRHVDPSLIDEWERIERADHSTERADGDAAPTVEPSAKAFRILVRNEAFSWIKALARRDYATAAASSTLDEKALAQRIEPYWQRYREIRTDAAARGPDAFHYDPETGLVRQTLLDPEGDRVWSITGTVDLARSREEGRAIVTLEEVGPFEGHGV